MSHTAGDVVLASTCLLWQFSSDGSWISGSMSKYHLTPTGPGSIRILPHHFGVQNGSVPAGEPRGDSSLTDCKMILEELKQEQILH